MTRSNRSKMGFNEFKFSKYLIIVLGVLILSACSGVSEEISTVEELEEPNTVIAKSPPVLPPFPQFVFCNLADDTKSIDAVIRDVEDGLASYKDLAGPMQELAGGVRLSGDMLSREDLFTDNPELLDWISPEEVPVIVEELNANYLWFARARVKLMDKGEYSLLEIKEKGAALTSFVGGYCDN